MLLLLTNINKIQFKNIIIKIMDFFAADQLHHKIAI